MRNLVDLVREMRARGGIVEVWVEDTESVTDGSESDSLELTFKYSEIWSVSMAASNALRFRHLRDDIYDTGNLKKRNLLSHRQQQTINKD